METTTLYYRQGSSDKIYRASLEPQNGGHVVRFAYGRRGATLQTGTKTQAPVSHDEAKRIYDKLIAEKTAKGYTPGEDGAPYQHTEKANEVSGIQCQLLNPIEASEVVAFISDPSFCMQEKFDGRRLLIRKTMAGIEGINRNGLIVSLPCPLVEDAEAIPGEFIIDGEAVGDVLWAFDVLLLHGRDVRSTPYRDRLFALRQIISPELGFIKLVDTAGNVAEKAALLESVRRQQREGVVFKRLSASYSAGRPSVGGSQLKHKFYETASFIVGKANGKRSVSLKLFDGTDLVPAGNATIPPNQPVPTAGGVVEVRYLYAFKESGAVYQPVYLGPRSDIAPVQCSTRQLKFKAEHAAAA